MPESLPSLDLLGQVTRQELDRAMRHADAVETKAGVMLGAAAALAAIGSSSSWRIPALLSAVLAAVAAIQVLLPQQFPNRELHAIRTRYLTSDRRFTELMLLDNGIWIVERMKEHLEARARWLRRAAALLVLSGILHALGTIVGLIGG